jgi:hypothetical protein
MGEYVDHGAAGILEEEATDAPRLVGERIHDAQSAAHGLGMRGINCLRIADVDPEARWRVLHPPWRDEDLSRGVGRRGEGKDRVLHRDFEPEDLDIELPRSRDVISIGVSNDSLDHPARMTAWGPHGLDEWEALLPPWAPPASARGSSSSTAALRRVVALVTRASRRLGTPEESRPFRSRLGRALCSCHLGARP